jgi:hypothetical protein
MELRNKKKTTILKAICSTEACVSIPFKGTTMYSKCHVTSNKAKSNLECAEDKFQTENSVVSMKHEGSVKVEERVLRNSSHHKLCAGFD